MKRNEFIKAAARACLACSGSAFLGGQEAKPPADKAERERLGRENIRFLNATAIHWSYPRCFCELVADGPDRLPAIYCQCSVGWVLEMFETVLQKPVRVKLVQSIKGGAASCVFRVEPAPKS